MPDGVMVHVHEADATTAHLVLPKLPAGTTAAQLSDAELLQVAGGSVQTVCHVTCATDVCC